MSKTPDPMTSASPRTAAIVVAAGKGLRAGTAVPKQFAPWRGKPLVRHSVEAFARAGISPIVVVVAPDQQDHARSLLEGIVGVRIVPGGVMRQESACAGLEALAADAPPLVLIHDAARPIVPSAVIDRLLAALADSAGAIPVLAVIDSLYREGAGGVAREDLHRVQTPQAFRFDDILTAHRAWADAPEAGDDAEVARAAGLEVALVECDEALQKVTFAADFAERPARWPRSGTGFDVHRLAEGEEVWLCGVRIEHTKGLVGHSDADVLLHAICDALLGALALGDIGVHFPDTDNRYKGIDSKLLLRDTYALMQKEEYIVVNIDATLCLQEPKIKPYVPQMQEAIAGLTGLAVRDVSIKATTTEGLGFVGRQEGVVAYATALLQRL